MIAISINGEKVAAKEGMTILEAARAASIKIPHLCYFEGLSSDGACGLCIVEVKGEKNFTRSCVRTVTDGMEIATNSPQIRQTRRMLVELLLSNHPNECHICSRNQDCELLDIASELGIREIRFDRKAPAYPLDETSPSIVRNPNKCVLCGRCIHVCDEIQNVHAIDFARRGTGLIVSTIMDRGLGNVECVNCGQCIHVCPVEAIKAKSAIEDVQSALINPEKHVVVQAAPAVRVALSEAMGLQAGINVAGKMYAALRKIGFDAVLDTNFTADLTIMEEGTELINRIKNKGKLPMFTSCCPGWVKYAEHFYQDLLPNLSTCKSPQQMFGSLVKTYYAQKAHVDPSSIVSVSIMPCTAKKFEAQRPEMMSSGYRDVDYVLTTRELVVMIRAAGIDFANLPDQEADSLMGEYTGAATIFGATGGVMEAALRTGYKLVTGQELQNLNISPVRGMQGIKEATVAIGSLNLRVAVAHGLGNASHLLDEIKKGKTNYHFIEVMACPGGCVGGGGQPRAFDLALRNKRASGLYTEDSNMPLRRSHENPEVLRLYEDYLIQPLGERSHRLLHTRYSSRNILPEAEVSISGHRA